MDYKEKYESAIKQAKEELKACGDLDCDAARQILRFFPELKESEDEMIREALIEGFNKLDKSAIWYNGITNGQILSWLEKQGRLMKALQISNARIGELIEENYYLKEKQGEHAKFYDSIQVGDKVTRNEDGVLVNLSQLKRVAKPAEVQGEQKPNDIYPIFRVGDYIKNKKTSDKVLIEQLDIAQKAYYYVSYDGAAINHSDFHFVKQDEWELIGQKVVEQKPAWSEDDEEILNLIIARLHSHPNVEAEEYDKDYHWLKSLKERFTWKPDELQLECLSDATSNYNKRGYEAPILKELLEQLKKLRDDKD